MRRRKVVPTTKLLNVAWIKESLLVVERDPGGVVRLRRERAPFHCFVRNSTVSGDFKRAISSDRRVVGVSVEGDYTRIKWRDKFACHDMCNALHRKNIVTYEGDINPVRRWMTDNKPTLADYRIAYLDFETDSRVPFSRKEEARILCWALVDTAGNRRVGILRQDTDEAERSLLVRLISFLHDFDLVVAWNGDRFDFPVLDARLSHCKVSWTRQRWLWLDMLVLFKKMNTMAAESGAEKQSYALNSIAMALLGEGKDSFDAQFSWGAWSARGEGRKTLVKYCVKDTDLLRRLEEKTGYIGLLRTLAETCSVFPDTRGTQPTNQAEGFLLSLGAARNYRFPTVKISSVYDPYKGAYVMEPAFKGLTENVHVADFASLYPSIIVTWNMSPETIVPQAEAMTLAESVTLGDDSWKFHHSQAPITGCFFKTDIEGILPIAVKEVMRLRKYWNKLKSSLPPGTDEWTAANRKATAYKIAANSFYGVIGSPMSRFFARDVAESVTQAGAWLIQETTRLARGKGMFAGYGDTDSVFVAGSDRTSFECFVKECNDIIYPKLLVDDWGCKENLISLAYEKEFELIVFTCMKRYIGRYAHYKGTLANEHSKPEVKGLEYKRGDSIRLARQLQAEVVDWLMGGGVVRSTRTDLSGCIRDPYFFEEVLDRWQHKILSENLELDDIVIAKTLSRDLDDYSQKIKRDGTNARQLPHIEVAKRLRSEGQDMGEGAKVRYYIFDATAPGGALYKCEAEWDGVCDRYELWDKMVFPPTSRLLVAAFPDYDWKRWARTRPKKPRVSRKKKEKSE